MSRDKIVKGFNDGCLLQKHNPDLAQKLHAGFKNKDFDYAVGFIAGVNLSKLEKIKSRTINYNIDKKTTIQKGTKNKDKNRIIEK